MKYVVSEDVRNGADVETPGHLYPAIEFRRTLYVASPRHMDAIKLAFAGFTDLARRRAYDRISEGKETIQFGFAHSDGSGWQLAESQGARMIMYGFD